MNLSIDKSNWKKVRLGDVAFEYSKRINNPKESDYDKFVGSSNVGQWDFRVKNWESTDSVTSAMKLFEPNDYLLVRRSLYASDFRERAPRAHFYGVCSGDILTIKENPEYLSDGFLIGVLNSPDLWKYIVANASGSITRRIKWKDLANYQFLLPPKDQQAKLAELLWALDEVIEREREVLERLNICKRSFEVKSLLKYNSSLDDKLPLGFKIFKLSEIAEISGGSTPSRDKTEYWGGDIPWLTPTDVTNHDRINLSHTKESITKIGLKNISNRLYSPGAILYCSRATIGYAIINDVPMATNQGFSNFIVNEKTKNYYLYFLLKHLTPELTRLAGGSTFLEISKSAIKNFKVVIPSIEVQEKIESKLLEFENNRIAIESKILSSKVLQKSLINQIF